MRKEECPIYGCFLDMCIQMTIIMVGKQFVSELFEILGPFVKQWYRKHVIIFI